MYVHMDVLSIGTALLLNGLFFKLFIYLFIYFFFCCRQGQLYVCIRFIRVRVGERKGSVCFCHTIALPRIKVVGMEPYFFAFCSSPCQVM